MDLVREAQLECIFPQSYLCMMADKLDLSPRTLIQVESALLASKANGFDRALRQDMLRHGRMTDDAKTFVASWR